MLVTLGVFVLIGAVELPGLIKDRHWRELAIIALVLVAGMALAVLLGMGREFPRLNL